MTRRSRRGFTLIELMVTTAIIGILSATALPMFQSFRLRARKAERETMVDGVKRSLQAVLVKDGKWPAGFAGALNPPGAPGAQRRDFNRAAVGWNQIDLEIQGPTYYSYSFATTQVNGRPPTLTLLAMGDLDGDGDFVLRTYDYVVQAGLLEKQADDPTEIAIDQVAF